MVLQAKRYFHFSLATVCLLFLPFAVAQPPGESTIAGDVPGDETTVAIEEALEKSGINRAIEQYPLAYDMKRKLLAQRYRLSAQQQQLLASTAKHGDADALKARLLEELAPGYEDYAMTSTLALFNKPVVEKFQRFERISAAAQQRSKLEADAKKLLQQHPVGSPRLSLLRKLHKQSFTTRLAALIQAQAEVDAALALDIISDERISRNDDNGIEAWQKGLEGHYVSEFAESADLYLLFTYRFITDEHLQEYIQIWQDKNVQWFMDAAIEQLRPLLLEQRQELQAFIARRVPSR